MRRLWTPSWIARHLLAVLLVVSFLGLGWWQLHRATGGNTLSWAYTLEWPLFAGFVVLIWVREMRVTLAQRDQSTRAESPAANAPAPEPPPSAGAPPGPGPVQIRRPVRVERRVAATDDTADDDRELASYNRFLAWLNANPGARPGDYPG